MKSPFLRKTVLALVVVATIYSLVVIFACSLLLGVIMLVIGWPVGDGIRIQGKYYLQKSAWIFVRSWIPVICALGIVLPSTMPFTDYPYLRLGIDGLLGLAIAFHIYGTIIDISNGRLKARAA